MKRRDHPSGKGEKHFYDTTLFLCMAFERVFRHSIGVFGAMLLYELWVGWRERDKRTFGTLEVMEEMKVKRRR
jgi:hypothetical protein